MNYWGWYVVFDPCLFVKNGAKLYLYRKQSHEVLLITHSDLSKTDKISVFAKSFAL